MNYKIGVPLMAAGLALSTGCSLETYSETPDTNYDAINADINLQPTSTLSSDYVVESTTPSLDNEPVIIPGETYRQLMQEDAPLNLIYVPNADGPYEASREFYGDDDVVGEQLLNEQDPTFLENIRSDIAQSTNGLYEPAAITEKETLPFPFLGGCIVKDNDAESRAIAAHVKDSIVPGAINVILIDAPVCYPDNFSVAGYSTADANPIIVSRGFGVTEIDDTISHEIGHSAGLGHAGTLACKDAIAIEDCESSPTADKVSIMGYHQGQEFSAPELAWLGLLPANEILNNPTSGTYIVRDNEQPSGDDAVRLINIETEKGTLSFSWQKDETAAFDTLCLPQTDELLKDPNAAYYTSKYDEETDSYELFVCLKVNYRFQDHSLQVRLAQNEDSYMQEYMLVTRPDRAPDDLGVENSIGEVFPNTVLYEDDSVIVTFIGTDAQNRAIVDVKYI